MADNRPAAGLHAPAALDLVRRWKWFRYIPPEAQEWVAAAATEVRFARGQQVYLSGDPAISIYGVASGAFRIYLTSPRGDEITMEEVVGGWFPHLMQKSPPPYLGNCVCLHDAVTYAVPVSVLAELEQRWPGWYRGLYEELTDRAVTTLGRIELLTLHTLDVRLAVYLLRMARLRGVAEAGGALRVPMPESQSEIGSRVGGTRQFVNAFLKRWANKGIIELGKNDIRILNIAVLTAEARKSGFDIEEYLGAWHGGWQGHRTPSGGTAGKKP